MATPEVVFEEEDGRFMDIQTGLRSFSSSSIGSAETSATDHATGRVSGSEMDEQRKQQMAYEYLCHLEETKVWIEVCVKEELPPTTELEESLTNGVYLAQLANFFAPEVVPLRRIFDKDRKHFSSKGLHFRHTDNINFFIKASEKVGLPKVFYPETTDIYDKKNMPKLIYCIHALSLFLFKLGKAPQIQDLYGKAKFTEEEISAMRKELEKYGIKMPAFSKIGGILASEMPVDEAELHAAIIAINDAIDHQDPQAMLQALSNPSAHLTNTVADNSDEYQSALYQAKTSKEAAAMARSPNKETEESDVYDTLLTQAEIQGNLNQVNDRVRRRQREEALREVVNAINRALDISDVDALLNGLGNSVAGLSGVNADNRKWYLQTLLEQKRLKQEQTGETHTELTQSEIQDAVNSANSCATSHRQMEDIVRAVNRSLDDGTPGDTHKLLQRPEGKFPRVLDRSAFLYHHELKKTKQQKKEDVGEDETLSHEHICETVKVLTTIATINATIEQQAAGELIHELLKESAGLTSVEDVLANRYLEHLSSVKQEKAQDCGVGKDDLTQIELQICVDFVNSVVQEETDLISAIAVINEAVDRGDAAGTLQSLLVEAAKLTAVHSHCAQLYQILLATEKISKAQKADDESAELWLNEIQLCLDQANYHSAEAHKLAEGVVAVNQTIDDGDLQALVSALQDRSTGLCGVIPDCGEAYLTELKELKDDKNQRDWHSPWLAQKTSQGHTFYYNKDSRASSWETPEGYAGDSGLLTKEQIQAVISRQTAEYDRWTYMQSNEPMIVKLQAHWKGYLARKAYEERLHFMKEQLPAIIRIQACVRSFLQRTRYHKRLGELHGHEDEAVKIQSWARMNLAQNKYQARKKYFRDHVPAIVKLQAWYRANVAQNDYRSLVSMQEPPVRTVRKFLHLLEHSDADFEEELEIQRMRAKVVTEVRSNQHLEHDLNLMDIKIGLLVKNRITLQDVVHHGKNLKREKEDVVIVAQRTKGIKSLSKESRERLEAYQHLFYLLQTNPSYLAKLIFAMPQSRATNFLESVILTLYNYASNSREEYLLLKLFEKALREEVVSKVDTMQDVVIGNPTVIKMVVNFNRGTKGQGSLRDLLQPLVKDILNDKDLSINTTPVEVYKAWINQMESETGEASKLPYDVDPEQALKHEEVCMKVETATKCLRVATDRFLNSIVQSSSKIPYGMRYVAMTLRQALTEKFPDASEDEILKVVGNLMYYRYMNPAIVAPDAFDVVSFGAERGLSPDQRRNLGSIAKLLQYAAMNKKFGGENSHLASLNDYIGEAHMKFKKFFLEVTTVEDPEAMFNIDEFTDIVMLSKPVIYISVQEICNTHTLLLEHKDQIASDQNDPLFELLDDLGDAPSIADLLGEMPSEESNEGHTQSAKTEISLTLINKFEIPEDDDSDMRALFVRTKRMIVDVLMVQPGDSLTEILETPSTDEQEEEHTRLMRLREVQDQESKEQNVSRSTSTHADSKLPLELLKRKIIRNLRMLESQGLLTIKNDYQDIINAVAKDIRNQRRYRQRRRQEKKKLQATLDSLHSKSQFYEEQIDYYNQYIRVCLDNLAKGKKTRAQKGQKKEEAFKDEVKYTAQRLYEKGVVLEIEGLPPAQFKNVMFIIKLGDEVGLLEVSAKFMGVAMEKVELVFQDLLQLQYEGVAVMKMFGRAKINVNLLIFLLNKKFYVK